MPLIVLWLDAHDCVPTGAVAGLAASGARSQHGRSITGAWMLFVDTQEFNVISHQVVVL